MRNGACYVCFPFQFKHIRVIVALGIVLVVAGCPEPSQPQAQPQPEGVLWLQFAQISDSHLLDDESPARTVRLADLFAFSWRPQEAYTTQVLDATLSVLNKFHTGELQPQRRLDFVIHTGDASDNAQYNELRWFMAIMDGQSVTPDSGVKDGPDRPVAPEDNPKLPFKAVGLLPEIPWYSVHGNHDALCVGNFAIDAGAADPAEWAAPLFWIVADIIGLHRFDRGLNALLPTLDHSPAIILGNMDLADPVTLKLRWDLLVAGAIPPDPDRHFIDREVFVAEHFNSVTLPAGHGFRLDNQFGSPLRYSARPKQDVPIRLVVLDTETGDPPHGVPFKYGVMTREQFDHFLKPEFQAARKAGEWVLLASHHPSSHFDIPYPACKVGQREFRAYLAAQPNLIAHICGDTHRNHLEMVSGAHPYPEIETGSLIDYPQEARILGLFYIEETHSFRVQSTMVSHMADPTRLSAESFRRASINSGQKADADAFAKRYGSRPEDLFPPDVVDIARVKRTQQMSPEERYGRPEDRDFSIVGGSDGSDRSNVVGGGKF